MFFKKQYTHKPIALTFDVELWHEGEWLTPYIGSNHPDDFFIESIMPLLSLLQQKNTKATFFVTDKVLKKYPEVIREIAISGHEIGSHSIKHTHLKNISPNDFEHELKDHVAAITRITGKPPRGFRAPHFSLTNDTKWVLPILAHNGFSYDSSIFNVKTFEYGNKQTPQHPYKISFTDIEQQDLQSPLLEVPVPSVEYGSYRLPVAGGIYFRLIPLPLLRLLIKRLASQTTLPLMYFHPHELYSLTPKINGPRIKTMLKYWGTNISFDKFSKLISNFEFTSIEELLSKR